LAFRSNLFEVHWWQEPWGVYLDEDYLHQYYTMDELENAPDGWFYDHDDRGGIVHVKTQALPTDSEFVVEVAIPVSVDEQAIHEQIKIFPNPSTGLIQVELPVDKTTEIKIFNAEGRLLTTFNSNPAGGNTTTLDLSSEPDGVYYLQIKSGNQIIGKKVTLVR
jgi:hypothetical protein